MTRGTEGPAQSPRAIAAQARSTAVVSGRLVLDTDVMAGRVHVKGDRILAVIADEKAAAGPYVLPGLIDVHVHGWGGHNAMDGTVALNGMARALLRNGITSFLPTAVTAPLGALAKFAEQVRRWAPTVQSDRAEPLGFNIEGPFISPARAGAQNPDNILSPKAVDRSCLEPLLEGLRVMTVAPEGEGALDLIRWLSDRGVVISLGHSDASADEAAAGYRAGARTTTHLFNAMTGVDHHAPGLAAAALTDDAAWVELIADGLHVDARLWPLIVRAKPAGRMVLVSDAVELAGMADGLATIGGLEVELRNGSCRLVSNGHLAGSVIALDTAVRNLVARGTPMPLAVGAASRGPADLLGLRDRGRLAPGQLADLLELDDDLVVRRVMKRGRWADADADGSGA